MKDNDVGNYVDSGQTATVAFEVYVISPIAIGMTANLGYVASGKSPRSSTSFGTFLLRRPS